MEIAELYNAAVARHRAGDLEGAERRCREVLAADPANASTLNLLGTFLRQQGRMNEAVEMTRQAVAARPGSSFFLFNLGDCHRALGQLDEAIDAYQRSLRLEPSPQAFAALGHAYNRRGRWALAAESFRSAIQLRPRDAGAHVGLAHAFNAMSKFDQAAGAAGRALVIDQHNAAAHAQLGIAMSRLRQLAVAAREFENALERCPQDIESVVMLASVELDRLAHPRALQLLRRALELSHGSPVIHSKILLASQYEPDTDEADLFAEHRRWAAEVLGKIEPADGGCMRDPNPDRALRIGYISPDFREHSVSYFIEPVLAGHDRRDFQAVMFSDCPFPDSVTKRLRGVSAGWHETWRLNNERLTELIASERIDILVDLAGHTAFNRLPLFARRAAPVQVSYLGYPNTTGLPRDVMQYRLTDAVADPPGTSDEMHTERLWRLPGSFLCYKAPADAPAVGPCPVDAAGGITFGCFNAMPKLSQWMVELWARLLHQVPTSRFVLKNSSLGDEGVRDDIFARFASQGIAGDRLLLYPRDTSTARHLERYGEIDIALDTFPYNGTTTTCEALWMGVPVVTLAGNVHRSRVGASLLSAIGLPELVASSADGYAEIAAGLARDVPRLRSLRGGLRQQMGGSCLMDAATFTRNLEAAYRAMWREACRAANALAGGAAVRDTGFQPVRADREIIYSVTCSARVENPCHV